MQPSFIYTNHCASSSSAERDGPIDCDVTRWTTLAEVLHRAPYWKGFPGPFYYGCQRQEGPFVSRKVEADGTWSCCAKNRVNYCWRCRTIGRVAVDFFFQFSALNVELLAAFFENNTSWCHRNVIRSKLATATDFAYLRFLIFGKSFIFFFVYERG